MKKIISFFVLLLYFQNSWSQNPSTSGLAKQRDKYTFAYADEKMEKVLVDVETKFKIKYSYVDSLISQKRITIEKKRYSLEEINQKITDQTALKISKIDNRFYAVSQGKVIDSIQKYFLDEIIVEGFVANGINKTSQKFTIYPQKVETLPGVTDADILLSLQQLPGVKSPNETASGLHVRGGTSDQNLILWDGIRLYHPGHLFGMISGINPNVEQTVNFYNKATNPKFGERISSIIDIKASDKIVEKTKINIGVNALNADLYVQTPLFKEKLGLQVSGRKSYTQWLQTPTFNQLAEKVFQNTNFNDFNDQNQFEYQDYSAKLNYKPNSKTELFLTALFIDNNLDFKSEIPGSSVNSQKMSILNYGYSLNWIQKYGSKWSQKTTLFYSFYDFDYEKKQQYNPSQFEAFKKLNRVIDSGAEMNFAYAIQKNLNLDFGYQALGNDISHLFNSYNQDIGIDLSLKHLYNVSHIGYWYLKYDIAKWNINAGARYNYYSTLKSDSFEPRILIQKRFSDYFIWQASYERKSQILSQVRESNANDLSLENYVWVLSENKDYPIQKANQFTTGFTFKKNHWLLDVDAYYKTIDGITTLTFGFLNQNDANNHKGKGFTKGVDVLLQKSAATWRTWITYTFQDSKNKFEDVNNNEYFQINSNIQHALNLAFNKKWGNYSIAAGWFWHSGKPYSSLNESEQVSSFNTQRLPAYHRLDISGAYQFVTQNPVSYKVGISIYNAYNNHTIISKEFERKYITIDDYIHPKYAVQDYYSLGITPNIFLRVSF
jgi:hypothetical protein